MKSAAKSLPNNDKSSVEEVTELHEIIQKKNTELKKKVEQLEHKNQQIEQLLDYIQLLRQKQFGRSSEKSNKNQINLFDEAELETLLAELDEQLNAGQEASVEAPVPDKPPAQKKKPVRRPLPAGLKRIEKIIDLPEDQKKNMGDDWELIGYETSEQLAVIPRQHYVIVTKRAKYVPVNDEVSGAEHGIKVAPRPDQIIPKSIGHSSVIADVVAAKFIDGLPLYRQEKIYARDGIDLSRQTMSGWIIQLETKLSPLMQAMKQLLYEGEVLHIDETRLQVLNEPNRENTQQSYMWVYRGGLANKPVIWYQYADNRSGQVPVDFLYPQEALDKDTETGRSFTILTDGYSGYHALSKMPGVSGHAACWAHARRKFVEASQGRKNTAAAYQMVAFIGKLYQIERSIKDKTTAERKVIRLEKAEPIVAKIKDWLDGKANKVLPKSLLGKAVHYTLGLWPKLITYLEDGHIPIDNNLAENAIRPFVIGRKAWMFAGSPRGARASGMLFSLIESAKANGLEPKAYLNHLFEHLPVAKTEQAVIKLLPQNIQKLELVGLGK